jgi:hypothetical protein
LSLVRYANGITFTVESNRLVITEERPAGNPGQSKIADQAIAYTEKLPHVRYTSVGVNFKGFCLWKDPDRFLIERFLKPGPWNAQTRPMVALGARFIYHVDDAVLRLSFDGGQIQREEESEPAVIINANFHSTLSGEERLDALARLVARWPDRHASFTNLTGVILDTEDSE